MPKAIIEELAFHTDARGLVIEPLGAEQLPAQRNVHVVFTESGAVRGNHFHEHGTEISVILGPALVRLREDDCLRDVTIEEGRAARFTFPPRVSHAMKNIGTKPMLIMAFNTEVFDRVAPDVIADVLIE